MYVIGSSKGLFIGPGTPLNCALPGSSSLGGRWDLPTRLEWALAPDRGVGVTKLGPWQRAGLRAMCGPWVQD